MGSDLSVEYLQSREKFLIDEYLIAEKDNNKRKMSEIFDELLLVYNQLQRKNVDIIEETDRILSIIPTN